MNVTTLNAVESLIKTDSTLTTTERRQILNSIKKHGAPSEPDPPQIISREKAGKMLDRSARSVDMLAKDGILEKITLPGRQRACGFRRADVIALIEGKR